MVDTKAVVAEMDALDGRDPEDDHYKADQILLECVPPEVREAYRRLERRAKWWAYA